MSETLEIGKTYRVNHERRGGFTARLVALTEDWATLIIVDGVAKAMLTYNEREEGESVTVRLSMCKFREVEAP